MTTLVLPPSSFWMKLASKENHDYVSHNALLFVTIVALCSLLFHTAMASSPSRLFAALLPVASESYGDENVVGFSRTGKETAAVAQIPPREVQVNGSAELSCLPDRATVSISVSSSKESVNDVKNSVSRRVEYILQTVRQHDVKVNTSIHLKLLLW